MKQQLLQLFAAQDKGNVLSGAFARWVAGLLSAGLVALGAQIPFLHMEPATLATVSGFVCLAVQGAISDWVARNLGKGIAELQTVTNAAGIAAPIPVDGVPGPITDAAHREVSLAAAAESPIKPLEPKL